MQLLHFLPRWEALGAARQTCEANCHGHVSNQLVVAVSLALAAAVALITLTYRQWRWRGLQRRLAAVKQEVGQWQRRAEQLAAQLAAATVACKAAEQSAAQARASAATAEAARRKAEADRQQAEKALQQADTALLQAVNAQQRAEADLLHVERTWLKTKEALKQAESRQQQAVEACKQAEEAQRKAEAAFQEAEAAKQRAEAARQQERAARQRVEAALLQAGLDRQRAEQAQQEAEAALLQAQQELQSAQKPDGAAAAESAQSSALGSSASSQGSAVRSSTLPAASDERVRQLQQQLELAEAAAGKAEAARAHAEAAAHETAQQIRTLRKQWRESEAALYALARQQAATEAERAGVASALNCAQAQLRHLMQELGGGHSLCVECAGFKAQQQGVVGAEGRSAWAAPTPGGCLMAGKPGCDAAEQLADPAEVEEVGEEGSGDGNEEALAQAGAFGLGCFTYRQLGQASELEQSCSLSQEASLAGWDSSGGLEDFAEQDSLASVVASLMSEEDSTDMEWGRKEQVAVPTARPLQIVPPLRLRLQDKAVPRAGFVSMDGLQPVTPLR